MKPQFSSPLLLVFAACLTACCSLGLGDCEDALAGCTDPNSFNYNPAATTSDNSCIDMRGCSGFVTGMTNSGSITNTLQNAYWDQKMSEEYAIQQQFFSCCPTRLHILLEPNARQKNAYVPYAEAAIYFGHHMFYYTISQYGELAVAGVLAHEFGHSTQNYFGWQTRDMYSELEADAWSGFYMALNKQWAWSQIQGYYSNVYAAGDYNFNSPSHHGTQQERLASAYLGVETAVALLQSGTAMSYQQLHQHFLNQIRTHIAPRNGRQTGLFAEVQYPKNLSRAYIQSLFPFAE
ncbi:M48 family metalloprotease [Cesiribacter andamanensis]|uniref:Putative metalloprotease n=1 Tax=Cesiribacter andamanensis AMV16 TaxID=1279009 RepID=M7NNC1_9BACT|nr:hypothetical protein [Cesiribacter andamanensis]EMR03225.1 putative metalloprotease [Cesiribacter andamanensis AMV16]